MEKFKPFKYVESDFEKLCQKHGLSNSGVCNDMVITAYGSNEFDFPFVLDLLNLINSWNNMSIFADKHIVFKFGLSGVLGRDHCLPYLRLWYEVDGIVSFSKSCNLNESGF